MEDKPFYQKPIVDQPLQGPEIKLSLDEYPFASTVQGGFGASLRWVPAWEQDLQGNQITSLYSYVMPGEHFFVYTVSSLESPFTVAPAWNTFPEFKPSKFRVNRPGNYNPVPLGDQVPSMDLGPGFVPAILNALKTLVPAL